jgi:hypothetical protein
MAGLNVKVILLQILNDLLRFLLSDLLLVYVFVLCHYVSLCSHTAPVFLPSGDLFPKSPTRTKVDGANLTVLVNHTNCVSERRLNIRRLIHPQFNP